MHGVLRRLIRHPIYCTDMGVLGRTGRTQQDWSDGLDGYRCPERAAVR
jgi:hypothetical protein